MLRVAKPGRPEAKPANAPRRLGKLTAPAVRPGPRRLSVLPGCGSAGYGSAATEPLKCLRPDSGFHAT